MLNDEIENKSIKKMAKKITRVNPGNMWNWWPESWDSDKFIESK